MANTLISARALSYTVDTESFHQKHDFHTPSHLEKVPHFLYPKTWFSPTIPNKNHGSLPEGANPERDQGEFCNFDAKPILTEMTKLALPPSAPTILRAIG